MRQILFLPGPCVGLTWLILVILWLSRALGHVNTEGGLSIHVLGALLLIVLGSAYFILFLIGALCEFQFGFCQFL